MLTNASGERGRSREVYESTKGIQQNAGTRHRGYFYPGRTELGKTGRVLLVSSPRFLSGEESPEAPPSPPQPRGSSGRA